VEFCCTSICPSVVFVDVIAFVECMTGRQKRLTYAEVSPSSRCCMVVYVKSQGCKYKKHCPFTFNKSGAIIVFSLLFNARGFWDPEARSGAVGWGTALQAGRSRVRFAGPNGRAVWGVGLRPLACGDCGGVSHWGHKYLSVVSVVCSQVEVSASSWSLVQRTPADCGASLCVI
jgi:hypothetical protein